MAQYYTETLDHDTPLNMVIVPGGSFLMGSPEDEPERSSDESPQHLVTVPAFSMGRYPITQQQWRVVAALPQINSPLESEPSPFKGNHPVVKISWHDATEFCDRLAQFTGRPYRLPSEAELEYACRAGTTTPFYFGNTIISELVNYDGNYTYNDSPKGEYRGKTTPVDHLSAWVDTGASEDANRVLRGGSYVDYPRSCRSAARISNDADERSYTFFGFRVVYVDPRT